MLTTVTRQAYSELDSFLELLNEEDRNKIPARLREYFKCEKDVNYTKDLRIDIPISEQNLNKETLNLIALLDLQYWCKDEEEKNRLKAIYAQNEKKYQDILHEKYNPNDIFEKKEKATIKNNNETNENMQMVEYKEPIFKKIINRIMRFFHLY